MERVRSRIARDLHDEIGSNLSSIAIASDLLGRNSNIGEMERSKLSKISSVALSTVKDMKDMVWMISPENDELGDLLLRMKDTAATILDGKRFILRFPEHLTKRRVVLEWKRNVYLIYKEVLTNVAKHAQATRVEIDVRAAKDRIHLVVTDNGIGFKDPRGKSGNGLQNMYERARLLGADLTIDSRRGRGTKITLDTQIT